MVEVLNFLYVLLYYCGGMLLVVGGWNPTQVKMALSSRKSSHWSW